MIFWHISGMNPVTITVELNPFAVLIDKIQAGKPYSSKGAVRHSQPLGESHGL